MSTAFDVPTIVQQIRAKKKYQHVDPELITFIASSEIKKYRTLKETVKATANTLHQIAWAYLPQQPDYAAHLQELANLPQDIHAAESRSFCERVMQEHTSTRERLPILTEFYCTLFKDIQPVRSILDLACGFNPLAFSWMPLEKEARYSAFDIFQDMASFLQNFFDHFHIAGRAAVDNLLSQPPQEDGQVALLLKTLPCLEQAEKDSARHLLRSVRAQYFCVSFPVCSIGGKEKGMLINYSQQFESLLDDLDWSYEKFLFRSELAYRVKKGA